MSRPIIELVFEFFEIKESSQAPRSPQGSPRELVTKFLGLPNRSKIGPKIDQKFDVILGSFLAPLGFLLASLLGPLGRPNRAKFGPRGSKIASTRPKMASRPAKMTFFYVKS